MALNAKFCEELTALINRHSLESDSDTPDWVLANYIKDCLIAWNATMQDRERWYGREIGARDAG